MSPTPDHTLADPQQLIAELQRQLAEAQQQLIERTAERDDGEAQKAAMAEVLGVINASPGDLTGVFQVMVEKALRLCEGSRGTLRIYDGETFWPQQCREKLWHCRTPARDRVVFSGGS